MSSTSVGIGVTTCNRPDYLQVFLDELKRHTTLPYTLYVHDDTQSQRGVAYSKNKCLQALWGHDYIFLFDDDCFVKPGWLEFFIEAHEASAQGHFLFMHPDHHDQPSVWQPSSEVSIDIYEKCSGVFMSLTKAAYEAVGYIDSRYQKYGYEHAGYSRRIHLARQNAAAFMCVTGSDKYLHAVDFTGTGDYPIEKYSSISQQEKELHTQIGGHNDQIYHDELANWHNLKRDFNE